MRNQQITLEAIEAKQAEVSKMIEAFKANAKSTRGIPQALIELKSGERYVGIVLDADGEPSHHLILLPGDAADLKWEDAKNWAAEQGGELPSRNEQSLLFANLKGQFQGAYYWSNQQYETESSWAWCQGFSTGRQDSTHEYDELRARAVRRLVI